MSFNRIRVAKDKADLVKALTVLEGSTGPFPTYADVMVFAATLGMKRKKRVALGEISREPSPISFEVFISRNYDLVFKLLAIAHTKDSKILSTIEPSAEEKRIEIFEEYANGGLEILRDELRGIVDYSEQLLLFLSNERGKSEPEEEFNLSRFL
ncbi:MAG: DNA phosphorothioation-associated protein 4 [Coleofasciculaceae cyanobacterium]